MIVVVIIIIVITTTVVVVVSVQALTLLKKALLFVLKEMFSMITSKSVVGRFYIVHESSKLK
jgi:hypothetical protein